MGIKILNTSEQRVTLTNFQGPPLKAVALELNVTVAAGCTMPLGDDPDLGLIPYFAWL